MKNYQHILFAVDYSEHCDYVACKAKEFSEQYRSKLSMIHVLDNIPMPDTQYGSVIHLDKAYDNEFLEEEKNRFISLADQLGIARDCRWLIWGSPKREIPPLAEREKVDLIIVGSHGRHGISLLLGSTADSVLHHAKCDVMAVRLKDD